MSLQAAQGKENEFYDARLLKNSNGQDLKAEAMALIKANLKEGVDEGVMFAISTLLNASIARSKTEVLINMITKSEHLINEVAHLH